MFKRHENETIATDIEIKSQDDSMDKSTEKISALSSHHARLSDELSRAVHDKYFLITLAVIMAVGLGLLALLANHKEPSISSKINVPKAKPAPQFYSPLTGLATTEVNTKRPVTAIMIENTPAPDGRPQSGLKEAGVVYEAIAEGGITRFVALYQESRPRLIGPVRSVRPYYVEWASAYAPVVAHVGGSQRALQMIRSGNYGVDLDQFFNGGTYWRVDDRAAPHNVYTSFDKLDALAQAKGKTSSTFTGFTRKDEPKLAKIAEARKQGATQANTINIDVSSGSFHVEYAYQENSNTYKRSHNGEVHTDREAGEITPKVVIAIKVAMSTEMEDGYREQITTTGTGQAYIFQDGTVTECTWSRENEKSRLVLTGSDGKEIALNRGQTWITALAHQKGVSWQ